MRGRPIGGTCSWPAEIAGGDLPAAAQPRGPADGLGPGRPGGVEPDQLRDRHLRGPYAGRSPVRRVQPRLCDLRVRAQRLPRPGHRPADGQVQRCRRAGVAACRGPVHRDGRQYRPAHRGLRARGRGGDERPGPGRLPRPRADTARAAAAGQLAVFVLRAWARPPGLPQRQHLGGDADPRPALPEEIRPRGRLLVCLRLGHHRGHRRRRRAVAGQGRAAAIRGLGLGIGAAGSRAPLPAGGHRRQRLASAAQLGIGFILGLASLGAVQASATLFGPTTILFLGMSLVTIPEAARVLRRSPRHLPLFCLLITAGLCAAGLAWGTILLAAVPRGLGAWLLGPIWRSTYPLLVPQTIFFSDKVSAMAPAWACTLWGLRGEACAWC